MENKVGLDAVGEVTAMLAMLLCLNLNGLFGLLLYVPVNSYGHVGMFA